MGVQKAVQAIVSRSSVTDSSMVGQNGSLDGLYGIGAGISTADGKGYWVNSVKSDGPADVAGVLSGDLLVSIDGRRPTSLGMLRALLLGPKGTAVDIELHRKERGDAGRTSPAGLPPPPVWVKVVVRVTRGASGSGGEGPVMGIGMGFKVSGGGGFVVSNVHQGGPADRAGVQAGDVLCTYNGESLANKPGSFLTDALSSSDEAIVRFGMRRDGKAALLSVVIVRTPLSVSSAPSAPSVPTSFKPAAGARAGSYSSSSVALPCGGVVEGGGYSSGGSAYDSDKSDRYDSDHSYRSRTSGSRTATSSGGPSDGEYSTDDDASSGRGSPAVTLGRGASPAVTLAPAAAAAAASGAASAHGARRALASIISNSSTSTSSRNGKVDGTNGDGTGTLLRGHGVPLSASGHSMALAASNALPLALRSSDALLNGAAVGAAARESDTKAAECAEERERERERESSGRSRSEVPALAAAGGRSSSRRGSDHDIPPAPSSPTCSSCRSCASQLQALSHKVDEVKLTSYLVCLPQLERELHDMLRV